MLFLGNHLKHRDVAGRLWSLFPWASCSQLVFNLKFYYLETELFKLDCHAAKKIKVLK